MAILKIVTFPNPVLKTRAEEITEFDEELEQLAEDMFDTMYDAPGVGLAANQVGLLKRIAVIDVDFKLEGGEDDKVKLPVNQNRRVLVNPVITWRGPEFNFEEGCLSVPGYAEEVKRTQKLKVKYQDLKGETHELEAEGLLAVAVQHEIDHLDGKLFIDRLSLAKRNLIKGKIKKSGGA